MPIEYHILPHYLNIGTTQNICAAPPTKNKISALPSSSPLLIVSINLFICSIPAIKVVAAAAYSNIVNFLTILYMIGQQTKKKLPNYMYRFQKFVNIIF